jgi:hypothetical protein
MPDQHRPHLHSFLPRSPPVLPNKCYKHEALRNREWRLGLSRRQRVEKRDSLECLHYPDEDIEMQRDCRDERRFDPVNACADPSASRTAQQLRLGRRSSSWSRFRSQNLVEV